MCILQYTTAECAFFKKNAEGLITLAIKASSEITRDA